MAFTQVLAQANRTGNIDSPPITIPAGTTQATFRLTSSNWVVGGSDVLAWAIDRSDDNGANWREITDGVTPEGARAKNGAMPAVTMAFDPPAPQHQIRARCRITGTLRFGLEQEIL